MNETKSLKKIYAISISCLLVLAVSPIFSMEKLTNEEELFLNAALRGQEDLITKLLAQGVNINVQNEMGETALIKAVEGGHYTIIEKLLQANSTITALTYGNSFNALHYAIAKGDEKIVEQLLQKGAPILSNSSGWLELDDFLAAAHLDNDAKTFFLSKNIQKMEVVPLQMAVSLNRPGIVALLLRYGSNPKAKDLWGNSALLNAVALKRSNLVPLLLKTSVNINARNDSGLTPLILATIHENTPIVKLLVKANAKVDKCDNSGWSPLHWAAFYGNSDIIRILLKAKANPNKINQAQHSPLTMSCYSDNFTVFQMLLRHGAFTHHRLPNGKTPLHFAIFQSNKPAIIKLLIDHGADLLAQDGEGKTAFAIAQEFLEHAQLLEHIPSSLKDSLMQTYHIVADALQDRQRQYVRRQQSCLKSIQP